MTPSVPLRLVLLKLDMLELMLVYSSWSCTAISRVTGATLINPTRHSVSVL